MKKSFTIKDLQFFATLKTTIGILPNFNGNSVYLMTGKVGPFKANNQTTVPLWFALVLKQKQKCKILAPEWLNIQTLTKLIDMQIANVNQPIYLHNDQFFEISYLFLNKAPDDIQNPLKVRVLIDSLQEIRNKKMKILRENYLGSIKTINLTTYQINKLRQPLTKLAEKIDKLKKQTL